MADLTPEQAIEKLKALPEDKQRAVLGKLSPESRKGILASLSAPQTAGQRYKAARDAGQLPKKDVFTFRDPKEFLQQDAQTLQQASQEEQYKATPAMFKQGKYAGDRPVAEQAGHALKAGLEETGAVAEKVASGLLDWKTAAAITAGLVDPAIPVAYFAAQGAVGAHDAAKDIKQKGLTPENTQDLALSTATVVGAGAGAGEGKSVITKVGELRDKFQPFARKITGVEPAVKEAVTKASEGHAADVEANKAKRAETIKQNLQTQREARTDIDRQKIDVENKNKGIDAENKAQAQKVAQRGALEKQVDTQSKELHEHLTKVEQSVANEANAKFNRVREKIGNPEAPADDLVNTVKGVETNVLQGIPESVKEFRVILKMEPLPENIRGAAEAHGFDLEGTEPLTWDKLQSLKSRLDTRIRNGRNLNGDLKRALYQTRDAVVGEMGKMAEANGATGEWQQARDAWRQYKEDFHEGTGPSGSGSPVAQALNAEDPKNIRHPFLRTQSSIGNRGVDILRKYPQHGGDAAANHVENLVKNHQSMLDLPSKETPKAIKPTPEAFPLPENKAMPARPETPIVDAQKVARQAIAKRAANWGSFNARDIGIIASGGLGELLSGLFGSSPFDRALGAATGVGMYEGAKYSMSRALNNPKVIAWLEKTPPEEAAIIAKIPGADKLQITNMLTDAAVKSGKPVNLSPEARTLLGSANVARILAASSAGVVKNRKEALDRLRPSTN